MFFFSEIEWSIPNMAGIYCGVQARIIHLIPGYKGHNANLTIVPASSKESLVGNMMDTRPIARFLQGVSVLSQYRLQGAPQVHAGPYFLNRLHGGHIFPKRLRGS